MNHIEETDYLMENGATLDDIAKLVGDGDFKSAALVVENGNAQEVMATLQEQKEGTCQADEVPPQSLGWKALKATGAVLSVGALAGIGCAAVDKADVPDAAPSVQFDAAAIKTLLGDNPEQTITQYIEAGKVKEAYTGLGMLYQSQTRKTELEKKLETKLDQRLLEDLGLTYQKKTVAKKEITVPVLENKTESEVVQTIMQYLGDSSSRVSLTAEQLAEIKKAKDPAAAMEMAQKYVTHNAHRISAFKKVDGEKTTFFVDMMGTDEKTGYAIIELEKGKVKSIKTDKDENMPKNLDALIGNLLVKDSVAYTRSGEMVTGFAGKAYLAGENPALAELVKKEFGISTTATDEIKLVEGKDSEGKTHNYVQIGTAIESVGDRDLLKEAAYAQAIKSKDWKALSEVYKDAQNRGDKENIEVMVRAYVLENPDQEVKFFDWHVGLDKEVHELRTIEDIRNARPTVKYRDTPATTTLKPLYTLLGEEKATSVILGYLAQDAQEYTPDQIRGIITRATNVEELKKKGITGTPLTEEQESAVNKKYGMHLNTKKSEIEISK